MQSKCQELLRVHGLFVIFVFLFSIRLIESFLHLSEWSWWDDLHWDQLIPICKLDYSCIWVFFFLLTDLIYDLRFLYAVNWLFMNIIHHKFNFFLPWHAVFGSPLSFSPAALVCMKSDWWPLLLLDEHLLAKVCIQFDLFFLICNFLQVFIVFHDLL